MQEDQISNEEAELYLKYLVKNQAMMDVIKEMNILEIDTDLQDELSQYTAEELALEAV